MLAIGEGQPRRIAVEPVETRPGIRQTDAAALAEKQLAPPPEKAAKLLATRQLYNVPPYTPPPLPIATPFE